MPGSASLSPVDLASNSFLRVLPGEVVQRLEADCVRKRVPAGRPVFLRGDAPDGVYCLSEGRLRVMGSGVDGQEHVLLHLVAGDWFGEIAAIDGGARTHDVYAVSDSQVLLLPLVRFRDLLRQHPELVRGFLGLACRRIRMLFALAEETMAMPLAPRLARRLLAMLDDHTEAGPDGSDGVALPLSHDELARMLGVSREAVGRQLREWDRQEIVCLSYGRIAVKDPAFLARLVESRWSPRR